MLKLDVIEVTWDDPDSIIDEFGHECESNDFDIEQQNLNVVVTKKRADLSEIVSGLMSVMGLGLAVQNSPWCQLVVGIFAVAVVSPFKVRVFKDPSTKDILDLIDSEYGDQYLDAVKLNKLYAEKSDLKKIVDSFIRKGLLEKEQDGRFYFVSSVIKNFEIEFLDSSS